MLLFIEFQKISSTKKWFSLTKISYQKKNNFLLDSGEENRSYFFHLISAGKLGKVDLTWRMT